MGSFNGLPARTGRAQATAPAHATPPARVKLMRAIHAACRKRGLDEEARRDLQLGATGKASMSDMDAAELAKVLDRLNRAGRAAGERPHVGKVRALWWSLYWLGEVDATDARAIDAFVKRQTGIAALRFLNHRQAASVVEALKNWARRAGVDWIKGGDAGADRRAVFDAIGALLGNATIVGLPAGEPARWTHAELDAAIRAAGRSLRKVRPR